MDAEACGPGEDHQRQYAGHTGTVESNVYQGTVARESSWSTSGRGESLTGVSGSPKHGAYVHGVLDPPLHSSKVADLAAMLV